MRYSAYRQKQTGGERMPLHTILIKPASGYCNMRCDYCFYCDEKSHAPGGK